MNVYIMTDIEGISGIYSREQINPSERLFAEGRRYMTDDINACAAGLKDAGVDKIYVRDCHGGAYTVLWNELSEDIDYCISGNSGCDRYPEIENCDAVILLGYHAMAGTYQALLEHSFSSAGIQNLWLNGVKTGEIGFDAAMAGEKNKPVIMVSGDDKTCAEARNFLPNVVTAEVKKAMTTFGAVLLPKAKAHKLLREKAKEAVLNFKNIKPYTVSSPVTIRKEVVERGLVPSPSTKPYMKIIDGRTFEVTSDSVEEAYWRSY